MSAPSARRITVELEYSFHNPEHPLLQIFATLPEALQHEALISVLDSILDTVNEGGTWVTLHRVSTSADGASPETTLTAR